MEELRMGKHFKKSKGDAEFIARLEAMTPDELRAELAESSRRMEKLMEEAEELNRKHLRDSARFNKFLMWLFSLAAIGFLGAWLWDLMSGR